MSVPQEFLQFVGLPYQVNRSPWLGLEPDPAVNCQLATHLLYQARYNVILPPAMWSKEIHDDKQIFRDVDLSVEQLFEGDIGIFNPFNNYGQDPRKFHLACFTGETVQGQPLFFHASIHANGVAIWPLKDFFLPSRYSELIKVKRLQSDLFNSHILPVACQ